MLPVVEVPLVLMDGSVIEPHYQGLTAEAAWIEGYQRMMDERFNRLEDFLERTAE